MEHSRKSQVSTLNSVENVLSQSVWKSKCLNQKHFRLWSSLWKLFFFPSLQFQFLLFIKWNREILCSFGLIKLHDIFFSSPPQTMLCLKSLWRHSDPVSSILTLIKFLKFSKQAWCFNLCVLEKKNVWQQAPNKAEAFMFYHSGSEEVQSTGNYIW